MAEMLEITGKVLSKKEFHSARSNQEYLLVEDAQSGKKYPVYISLDRSSSLRARKFRKETFEVGDVVAIKGKTQKLVAKTVAGMDIIQESDLDHKDAGLMSYAVVVVPREMTKESP